MRDIATTWEPDFGQEGKDMDAWKLGYLLFLGKDKWLKLRTLACIVRTRCFASGRETTETVLSLGSLPADAPTIANAGASKTNAIGASTSSSVKTPVVLVFATPRATSYATVSSVVTSVSNAFVSPLPPPFSNPFLSLFGFYALALITDTFSFQIGAICPILYAT